MESSEEVKNIQNISGIINDRNKVKAQKIKEGSEAGGRWQKEHLDGDSDP